MPDPDLSPLAPLLASFGPQGRTALLPALHAVQKLYRYIPEAAAVEVGRTLGVPLADIYGVMDFYTLFNKEPPLGAVIHVCNDPACALAGSDTLMKTLAQRVAHAAEGGEAGGLVTIEKAPCLGLCEHAPALSFLAEPAGALKPENYADLVQPQQLHPRSMVYGDIHILTANCGRGHTTWLEEYQASGGYQGLRRALAVTPEAVIAEVKAAGLVGRGGAAFPTGLKWEGAHDAPGPVKYVVCNADEAEPGTFKDRILLEDDPHRALEGLIISAYAIGAQQGYIYIRGEYQFQEEIMQRAVDEARLAGLLGTNILGSGFDLEVEIRRGAGAYVCGEETALFESIEGKRGLPRVKPPFPTTYGLFGKPTVINNVETLANIPTIIQGGADAYRRTGTQKSPGTKLFCLSGDVTQPGLYEVPFGTTFRHLLNDLAGGVRGGSTNSGGATNSRGTIHNGGGATGSRGATNSREAIHNGGRSFKAALFGGAAGAFATPKDLDVRLSFEDLRAAGLPLGSGVITVLDDTRDLKDILLRLARFFAEESCGKCFPCQLGTQRQVEILRRVVEDRTLPGDFERLQDIGATMTDASLCGLGQTAGSAIGSAARLWPELFH